MLIWQEWTVGSSLKFYFDIKPLYLWATNQGVRMIGLPWNFISEVLPPWSFKPTSHDWWGLTWAPPDVSHGAPMRNMHRSNAHTIPSPLATRTSFTQESNACFFPHGVIESPHALSQASWAIIDAIFCGPKPSLLPWTIAPATSLSNKLLNNPSVPATMTSPGARWNMISCFHQKAKINFSSNLLQTKLQICILMKLFRISSMLLNHIDPIFIRIYFLLVSSFRIQILVTIHTEPDDGVNLDF